ncbi:MAG: YihY family inner membrane protein [Alphaproteobacteria bacterium]
MKRPRAGAEAVPSWTERMRLAWRQRPKPVGDAVAFLWYVLRRFDRDNGLMVASSLTYTSLLGLVPILAIFLAVLAAFPAFDQVRDQAMDFILSPLVPEASAVVFEQITTFLRNTRELTLVGILGLAVTALILLWTIESAFNTIWRVVEPRSWGTRLLAFWTILTLTPILIGASVSLGQWFAGWGEDEIVSLFWRLLHGVPALIPVLMQFAVFSLLFWIIPHRRMRLRHSLAGGAVAAVLFEILKIGFGYYLGFTDSYRIVYGALATIPIFLLWIYLSWCMILFGAEFAAAIPDWRLDREMQRVGPPTSAERLAMVLAILRAIGVSSEAGERPHREVLEHRIAGGAEAYSSGLGDLIRTGYVVVTEDERLAVARDLSDTTIFRLIRDLDLDLGIDVGPHFGQTSDGTPPPAWVRRLCDLLGTVDRTKRDLLALPVKAFMAEPRPGAARPASPVPDQPKPDQSKPDETKPDQSSGTPPVRGSIGS